jgi:hypothetical protein
VQVGPGDDIRVGARRQFLQAKPAQHPAEADFDADKHEPIVDCAGEHHVGYAGKSLAHNVDDLGVDDVASEKDLVVAKRLGGRSDRERGWVIRASHQYAGVFEALDRGPRHQQVWCAVALHEEPVDQRRPVVLTQPDREIGNAPGEPAVAPLHVLAGHPAEQKHSKSMPE